MVDVKLNGWIYYLRKLLGTFVYLHCSFCWSLSLFVCLVYVDGGAVALCIFFVCCTMKHDRYFVFFYVVQYSLII